MKNKKIKRYVLEAIWSGYNSSQIKPCHRIVLRNPKEYENIKRIIFTDGTYMSINIRPCLDREKIKEIHGYDSLFDDIICQNLTGFINVMDVK